MKIAVIGGGASGLMSAYFASLKNNNEVWILEKNEKLGKKIYITGKGRCNLTNTADVDTFLNNVVTNHKFLYSALNGFTYNDLCEFCSKFGLEIKVERGGRVFPSSDKASDVTKMLETACVKNNVKIKLNSKVTNVEKVNNKFVVEVNNQKLEFDKVIICTGGFSYKDTGSDGDGYMFASNLGHSVEQLRPALVPIVVIENVKELEGLSLKNVTLTASQNGKVIKSLFGEMLFTAFGISGPIALSMSSFINKMDVSKIKLEIDLKPSLNFESLEKRFFREVKQTPNISFKNLLKAYLPKSLIEYFLNFTKISGNKELNSITIEERKKFISNLKSLPFNIKKLYDINVGIITSGGVKVSEINPKTMESKIVSGLYFAGEVIDVDALTGGFNMHIAFATGRLAGINSSK